MRAIASSVVIFTGLPGTGKSTLAETIARTLGAPAFAGDWLLGALKPAAAALRHLDRQTHLALYRGLLRSLIERQLILGQSALVDCVVPDEVLAEWSELAGKYGATLTVVECVCSYEAVHRSRVDGRIRGIPGWHEIDWAHVERMRAELAPLTSDRLVVDAVRALDYNVAAVLNHLERTEGGKLSRHSGI